MPAEEARFKKNGDVLQAIVEGITDPIFVKDIDGCYTVFNTGAARITGKSATAVIGRNDTFLFPPAKAKAVMAADRDVMASRTTKTYEETITMPSGEARTLLTTKGPLINRHGEVFGLFGVSRDVTERKQVEARLQQFVEQSPFAVCMLDTEMRYIITSNRWISDYGLKTEVIGKSHYEVFPEIPEHWKVIHRRCLAGAIEKNDEEAFQRADGSINWIRWEVRPWYEFDGKIGGILIFSEDITARKQLEETLRERQQFLVDSQEVAKVGSWALDLPSSRLTWTEQSYRNFGVSSDTFTLSAESFFGLIHPDDRTAMQEWIRASLADERPGKLEFRIILPDGTLRDLEGRGRLICDDKNRPIRMIGTNLDITERKQVELALIAAKNAAEEAVKSKSTFLDIAAHELRNPVAAISLLLQVVQKQIEKGQSLDPNTLVRLREPVDRLTRLVVDLLDVSRLERGLICLRLVRSDISSLVSRCVEEFQLQAPKRRLTFTKPEQLIEIDLDPVRINQVLSNFLDNAVKYTPRDSPIEVTVEPTPKVIRVSVIDHGAGIPQQQLDSLFTAFARGSSEATIRASGLGLGLSICRGIVELHGGTIGALSEVGRGSTFYFELPRLGATP